MWRVKDFDIPTHLTRSGPPLPMPGLPNGPNIRFLTAEQVREETGRLKNPAVSATAEDEGSYVDEALQAAREEFRSYLQQADERGLDLVIFQY
jgi:hypothetical protein